MKLKQVVFVLVGCALLGLVFPSVALVRAQSGACTVVDTFTGNPLNSPAGIGTYALKVDYIYKVTISGSWIIGSETSDAQYYTNNGWASTVRRNMIGFNGNFGLMDADSTAYNSSHVYDYTLLGSGSPLSVGAVDLGATWDNGGSFTVQVCEYAKVLPTIATCVVVDTYVVSAKSSTQLSTITTTVGRTYRVFVTGQWAYDDDDSGLTQAADAQWRGTWRTTYSTAAAGFSINGVAPTPISSAYNSDHQYAYDIAGTGSQLTTIVIESGTYADNLGGATVQICDLSLGVPTAVPTVGPTSTPLPVLPSTGWAYPISTAERWEGSSILGNAVGDELKELDPVLEAFLDSPAVLAFGESRATYVHAVYGGTVTGVVNLSPSCDPEREYTNVVQEWLGRSRSWCYQEWNPVVPTRGFRLSTEGTYLVTVTLEDNRQIRYAVSSPRVEVGDTVSTGCILGTLSKFWTDDLSVQIEQSAGWTFVQGVMAGGAGFNLLPYLTDEPQDIVCAKTSVDSACKLVANPTFSNRASGWDILPTTGGSEPFFFDGLALRGTLSQVLTLDSTKQYTITVKYRVLESPAYAFNIRFGAGDAINIVPEQQLGQVTKIIPAATYTPNSNVGGAELYSLIISSRLESATVAIDFICVSEANEPPPLPSACIFNDPDFESEFDTVWESSGDWGEGWSILTGAESFSQSVKLNPSSGGGQTYKLEVVAAINPLATSPFATTNIGWDWGTQSGTLGPLTSKTFSTFTATFTVSTVQTNDFLFDLATSSESVLFDRVCLSTNDGTPPPGYEQQPPLKPACRTCIFLPSGELGTDLANLVRWLACFILQLWECQAKIILYGIWTTVVNILTFMGFLRLWLLISLQQMVNWSYGALQVTLAYFNGQFVNLGNRFQNALSGANISTVIYDDGASLGDIILEIVRSLRDFTQLPGQIVDAIRDIALGLFDFLSDAIGGLATVLTGLIALAQTVFETIALMIQSFIANVLGTLISLIVGVVNGFNIGASDAIDADWIPDCNDPASAMFTVCVALALIENEINAGPAVILIPLLIGVMSLSTILWAIERLSAAASGGDNDE